MPYFLLYLIHVFTVTHTRTRTHPVLLTRLRAHKRRFYHERFTNRLANITFILFRLKPTTNSRLNSTVTQYYI